MKAAALALALCGGCASHRLLPLPGEPGPMPVRYEKTRLFFHSVEEDGALARVFAGPGAVLATVAQPEQGVFASTDGGRSWVFTPAPLFDAVLFATRGTFALAGARVLRSSDRGRSWEAIAPGDEPVEALAVGPDGTLYAGGRGHLYVSADAGRTFRIFTPRLPSKNWRIRSIAAVPGALYLSVRGDPAEPQNNAARFANLLGYSSSEALDALALVDSRDPTPHTFQWGTAGDGVYISRDGGASFARTGLMVDAWLVALEGGLHAVAADPLLQAAALMRRYPDLAGAADRHLRGDRASAAALRAACVFPGDPALLAGPIASAPIFRSAGSGSTWTRQLEPSPALLIELRENVERFSWSPQSIAQPSARGQRSSSAPRHGGRGGRRGPAEGGARPVPRTAAAETMLSFVDPARLLAHYNSGLPLSGVSNGFAYLPTPAYWDALTAAMAAESESEGEISLGPGLPDFPTGAAFEVLRSWNGTDWTPVAVDPPRPGRGIAAYPASIAGADHQVFFVLAGMARNGDTWRGGLRIAAP